MTKKINKFLTLLLFSTICSAQLSDLAKLDYTKINDHDFFLIGLDYSKIEISFDDSIDNFEITAIEDFQFLDLNIGYTFKMNVNWRFGARFTPGFSSNLVRQLSFKDAIFSGDIVFINDKKKDSKVKKPYQLILGISYSGNKGILFPKTFISYYRKSHPKWSFKLGVPKTNLQYHLSEKSRFKPIAELDGLTSNIQGGLIVDGDKISDKANMSIIIGGPRYEYKITEHQELFCNLANTMSSSAKLKDRKTGLSFA